MEMHVLCVSYGNDSIALMQQAYESGMRNVHVLFNDTGWAAPEWEERVRAGEYWATSHAFIPHRTASVGMEALVKKKKAWPRQGIQFCTEELKIIPTLAWLAENDPDCTAVLYNGKRRAESANRSAIPLYTKASESPLNRITVSPLYLHTDAERDALIASAGFDVLPHRSMECSPCINSNRADLLHVPESVVANIARIEAEMGVTKKGKPRTMFRPYRYMKATGIREIIRWAKSPRGKFDIDDGNKTAGCDSGMCGG